MSILQENAYPTEDTQTSSTDPFEDMVSLYLRDLPKVVSKQLLYDTFSKVADVESCTLCFDSVTGESRGYAFINFKTHEDAKKAKEKLSNIVIDNQICRISWKLSDIQRRSFQKFNVFIKNIPKSIITSELYEICSRFGRVLTAKAVHAPFNPTGHGFVQFESEAAAQTAIKMLNGAKVDEIVLSASIFEPKTRRPSSLQKNDDIFTNVFVKNIPIGTPKKKIVHIFEEYGKITSSYFPSTDDGDDEKCQRPFAILNYEAHGQALEAVKKLHEYEIQPDVKLYVTRHKTKVERQMEIDKKTIEWRQRFTDSDGGHNLYVVGMDSLMTNDRLREVFGKYGTLGSVKVEQGPDGKCRGFGYVYFLNVDDGRRAESELNGSVLDGKPIRVCAHQPRAQRYNMLYTENHTRGHSMTQPMPPLSEEKPQIRRKYGRGINFYNLSKDAETVQPGYSLSQSQPYLEREMSTADGLQGSRLGLGKKVWLGSKAAQPGMDSRAMGGSEEFPKIVPGGGQVDSKPGKAEVHTPHPRGTKGGSTSMNSQMRAQYSQPAALLSSNSKKADRFGRESDDLRNRRQSVLNTILWKLEGRFHDKFRIGVAMRKLYQTPIEELVDIANNDEYFNSKFMELRNTESLHRKGFSEGISTRATF